MSLSASRTVFLPWLPMIAAVASLWSVGCSGGSGKSCLPGEQRACACANGGQGVQLCKDDGSGLGACLACGSYWDAAASSPDIAPDATPPRDPLNLDNLVFDVPANWVNVDGRVLKANSGTDQFAYLRQSTSGNTSLRIEMHVEWHSSGDLTGIIFRNSVDSGSLDGYYFLLYPYQNRYKLLKVVGGIEQKIEEGDCQANPSNGWQSLAVKASTVQISGQPYNRFDVFARDQLATTVQDNSFTSWYMGFGKYKWESGTEGYAQFSNISEP